MIPIKPWIFFTDAQESCFKCLISLYEHLKYLTKISKLKHIRNLVAYTLKCFTVKRCMLILFRQGLPKKKTIRLLTTQQITEFLKTPNLNGSNKVFICPKAQEGLTEEESKKLLHVIGRLHCRGKGWGPKPGEYLQWLCNNVLDLVKKGKIQKPKNLISYTINCHKTALLAKFMDERHERKILL